MQCTILNFGSNKSYQKDPHNLPQTICESLIKSGTLEGMQTKSPSQVQLASYLKSWGCDSSSQKWFLKKWPARQWNEGTKHDDIFFLSSYFLCLVNKWAHVKKKTHTHYPLRLPWLKQTYRHTLQDQHDNSASQTTCPLRVLLHKPLRMGSVRRDAMYKATARTQQHKHNQNDQILSDVKIRNVFSNNFIRSSTWRHTSE